MADKKVGRDAWIAGRVWRGTDKDGRPIEQVIVKDSAKINYKFCLYTVFDPEQTKNVIQKGSGEFPHRQMLKYLEPTKQVVEVTDKMLQEAGLAQ